MKKIALIFLMVFTAKADLLEQGNMFLQQQKLDAAYDCFSQLLATQKIENPYPLGNALLTLGNAYFSAGNMHKAVEIFYNLANMFPQSSAILYNLGYCLVEVTRYQEAVEVLKKALDLKSDALDIRNAHATALLAIGNYEEGWQAYEYRWQRPERKNLNYGCPRWDGHASLAQKTILLVNEGALGDCLQFVRYAQLIKSLGAQVIMLVPEALKPLINGNPYIDSVITSVAQSPRADYYSSLMSLPAQLRTTLHTIPTQIPYIFPEPHLKTMWQKKLAQDQHFKIGICWQADQANDANRPQLAQRSFAPELFSSFAQIPNVTLYSLQKDERTPSFIYNFGSELDTKNGRFMDTAAIIANLDLVITVDTSIAHLSGALGKPTWLILPFKADWRWLENNVSTSPWYPTMRIFRKEMDQSWQDLLVFVAAQLSNALTSFQGIVP